MYLYVTEQARTVVRGAGLHEELRKLERDAASEELVPRLDEIGGSPGIYKHNYSYWREIFRVYDGMPVLVLLDVMSRSNREYEELLYVKDSKALARIRSLEPTEDELRAWLEEQRPAEVRLEPAADAFYELWLSPLDWDDAFGQDYWLFETLPWIERTSQPEFDSHAGAIAELIVQELTEPRGQLVPGCGDVRLAHGRECAVLYTTSTDGNLLLMDVFLVRTPSLDEARDVVVKQWSESFCTRCKATEDLRMVAWRAYPVSVIDSMDAWRKVRDNADSNLALSAEEEALVAEATRPASDDGGLPMFIDGRAGSGKSTMLWHLFARQCDSWLRDADGVPGIPLYVTYSPALLERAREGIGALLRSHYSYLKRQFDEDAARRIDGCFTTLSAYLGSHLLPDAAASFDADRRVDYREFVRRFRSSFKNQAAVGVSPETAWFIIRSLIKGRNDEEYLDPDTYQELARKDRSVSLEDFRTTYEKVWTRWYEPLCREEGLWDDQDLARQVLRQSESGHIGVERRAAALFCDEAQDFTRVELAVLLASTVYACYSLDPYRVASLPFVFAGDPSQTLNPSGFRWGSLTSAFYLDLSQGLGISGSLSQGRSEITLHRNYRSARPLVELANSIQLVRLHLLGPKTLTPQESWRAFESESPRPLAFCIDEDLTHDDVAAFTEDTIIIVPCEEGAERDWAAGDEALARLVTGVEGEAPPNVMSASAAKGLEFEQVVLYKFGQEFCDRGFDLEPVEDEGVHDDLAREYFFNKLYVAASRARSQLYVVDTLEGLDGLWRRILDRAFLDRLAKERTAHPCDWVYPEGSPEAGEPKTGVIEEASRADLALLSGGQLVSENAETLFAAGRDQRNPTMLRRAWRFFLKLDDAEKASLALAWALQSERMLEEAGREFERSSEPWRALGCYWEGMHWRHLADYFEGLGDSADDTRRAAAAFMCTEGDVRQAAIDLAVAIGEDLVGPRTINPLSPQWSAVVDRVLFETEGMPRRSRKGDRLAMAFAQMGASGFERCSSRAAELFAASGDHRRAVECWEAAGETEGDGYLAAQARLAGYPDAMRYVRRMADRGAALALTRSLWEEAPRNPASAPPEWLIEVAGAYSKQKAKRLTAVVLYRAAGEYEMARRQLLVAIESGALPAADAWSQLVELARAALGQDEWLVALLLVDGKEVRDVRDRDDPRAVGLRFEIARSIARSDAEPSPGPRLTATLALLREVQLSRGWEDAVGRKTLGLAYERACRHERFDEALQYYYGQMQKAQRSGDPDLTAWARQRWLVVEHLRQESLVRTQRDISAAEQRRYDELLEAGGFTRDYVASLAKEDPRDAEALRERPQALVTPLGAPFLLPKRTLADGTVSFELGGYRVLVDPQYERVNITVLETGELLSVHLVRGTFSGDALESGAFVAAGDGRVDSSDGESGLVITNDRVVIKTAAGSVDVKVQHGAR